jgi:hypothetical protein
MAMLSLSYSAFLHVFFFASSGLLVIMIEIRWLSTTEATKMAHLDNLHHHSPGSWFAGVYVPSL